MDVEVPQMKDGEVEQTAPEVQEEPESWLRRVYGMIWKFFIEALIG